MDFSKLQTLQRKFAEYQLPNIIVGCTGSVPCQIDNHDGERLARQREEEVNEWLTLAKPADYCLLDDLPMRFPPSRVITNSQSGLTVEQTKEMWAVKNEILKGSFKVSKLLILKFQRFKVPKIAKNL